MCGRARQVEKCGAGGVGRRTADADLHAVRQDVEAPRSAMQRVGDVRKCEHPVESCVRIRRGRDDLDVADHVLAASQRAHRLRPSQLHDVARKAVRTGIGDVDMARPSQRHARNRRTQCLERVGDRGFDRFIGGQGTRRIAPRATSATRSPYVVTPSAEWSVASWSSVTAPDSKSHRRSTGRSAIADSSSTHPPASYM